MNRKQIFEYVSTKYKTLEEYPWEKFPQSAVLRHNDNSKWFGISMNVSADKLGLDSDKMVDILDVKCDPSLIDVLRHTPGFLPAYHMNKEHWLSILLDGTVSQDQICDLIDKSYELTQ